MKGKKIRISVGDATGTAKGFVEAWKRAGKGAHECEGSRRRTEARL